MRPRFLALVFCTFLLTTFFHAQEAAPSPKKEESQAAGPYADVSAIVAKQFGKGFTVMVEPTVILTHIPDPNGYKWEPLMTGDLDGDGVEDAIIIVRSRDALGGAAAFDYKVIDPKSGYFGWSD